MAVRAVAHRSLFLPLLAAVVALAWTLLFLRESLPYALFLNHSMMRVVCLAASLLSVLNLYVLGWVPMVAVAAGNVGWMLALAAVMVVEKNLPWGRHLSAPLGVAFLTWAGLIALDRLAA